MKKERIRIKIVAEENRDEIKKEVRKMLRKLKNKHLLDQEFEISINSKELLGKLSTQELSEPEVLKPTKIEIQIQKPKEREEFRMSCEICKVMDVAMQIMTMLQFRYSNGTIAMGIHGHNLKSIIQLDMKTKDILINEDGLMRAIMLANPGQGIRKLKLISAEEFKSNCSYTKFI